MNCLAFLLELRNSIEENFLRATDFFLERIDDDRRLIDLACRTIWSHIACLRGCMHMRSHRLKDSRIQSSWRREIDEWRLLIIFTIFLFLLLSLLSAIVNLHGALRWASHVLAIVIRAFDSIATIPIVFVVFSAFVAFWFVRAADCFVAELLTAKASINSNQRFVSYGWISYAIDRYVRTSENLLDILIRSKIKTNPVDRLSVAKESCHLNSRQISLSDQRSYRIDVPFTRNTVDHDRIGRWNSTRRRDFECQSRYRGGPRAALE